MALGSTQPLTEMSTGIFPWGKGGRCVELTTLPPSCGDCLKMWEPQPVKACNGVALPFTLECTFYRYLGNASILNYK
jgi:hypothetical protein